MNGRDPEGLGEPSVTREIDLAEQRARLERELQQAEDDSGWGSILSDTLRGSVATITSPVRAVLQKRAEIQRTFVQTGRNLAGLAAPKAHLETDAANREAAAEIGSSDALMRERAARIQNTGLRKIAQKGGEWAGEAAYQGVEAGVIVGAGKLADFRRTFFEAHPETEGKVVVHHGIEQQAVRRYPNAISEEEVHELENLRGIPKDVNADIHLSKIRKEWNDFYKTHPNATRQELDAKRLEIDTKFCHQFNPPVSK